MFFCSLFCLYSSWVSFSLLFISVFHVGIFLEFFKYQVMLYTWEQATETRAAALCWWASLKSIVGKLGFSLGRPLCGQHVKICSSFLFSNSISPKKNLWSPVCVGSDRRLVFWKWIRKQGPGAGLLRLIIQSAGFHLMPLISTWCISFPLHSN